MHNLSNWQKYRLLMWKNWKLQGAHKVQLAFIILLPILCCCLLAVLRLLIFRKPRILPQTYYMPFDLTDFRIVKNYHLNNFLSWESPLKLAYTPQNKFIDNIIWNIVAQYDLQEAVPFENSVIMERALIRNEYFAGVDFGEAAKDLTEYPKRLKVTLRVPSDLSYRTNRLYDYFLYTAPINYQNFTADLLYINEGFVHLQHAIATSYLQLVGRLLIPPRVFLQRRPEVEHFVDESLGVMELVTFKIIYLSFLFPLIIVTKYVSAEKESQLKEIVKLMGIPARIHWMAWFTHAFILLSISSIVITIIFFIPWPGNSAIFNFTDWTIFFISLNVYIVNNICFCFMVSVIFSKSSIAAAAIFILSYLGFLPYFFLRESENDKIASMTYPWCLLMNTGFGVIIKIIFSHEAVETGSLWNNIFTPLLGGEVALGYVLLLMSAGCILFLLICLYVEQIHPGEYGVPKKWTFPLKALSWSPTSLSHRTKDWPYGNAPKMSSNFEKDFTEKPIGLAIENLTKHFGNHVAVDGVSFNMHFGEITVLLGHNGAGKTTMISMLTGMMEPTSGTALVDGYDIREDLEAIRSVMGICPQKNVIFDEMSVADHLKFYCTIKGLKGYELQNEIENYLRIIDLEDKAKVKAKYLSGGQKRKLCVCYALCGNTRVVLLDEPSSGMDPAARRHLWQILQRAKKGRVILLTTHFMDEADLLGDRVAIMCDGQLKCFGSPFFLKTKYGSGYRLIFVKLNGCKTENVTAFLRTYIRGIEPLSDIGSELTFTLPLNYKLIFEEMLRDLDKNLENLKLDGYGISVSTMEEVFMKVGEESHNQGNSTEKDIKEDSVFTNEVSKVHGVQLLKHRWEAMFLKRILYLWRNWPYLIIQIFIPTVFLMFTIAINKTRPDPSNPDLMTFSLNQYPNSITIMESPLGKAVDSFEYIFSDEYRSYVKMHGVNHKIVTTEDQIFEDYLLNHENSKKILAFHYIGAAKLIDPSNSITVWFNPQLRHELPLSLNLVHNAMARSLLGDEAEIIVTNHPLPKTSKHFLKEGLVNFEHTIGVQISIELGFAMPFTITFFIIFIVKDSSFRSKLLQYLSGINVWTYWLSNLIWDLLIYLVIIIVFLLVLRSYRLEGFVSFHDMILYFWILLLFGLAAICLTYLLSFMFIEPATAYVICAAAYIITGILWNTFTFIVNLGKEEIEEDEDNIFQHIGRAFPFFVISEAFANIHINSIIHQTCATEEIVEASKVLSQDIFCEALSACCDVKNYLEVGTPGVGEHLISLSCVAAASFILIILIDLNICARLKSKQKKSPKDNPQLLEGGEQREVDDDVAAEKVFIEKMSPMEIQNENVVVDRITKQYREFRAVKGISFHVKSKECFGLMGVNGAGKTTTFKMLTGDIAISQGSAWIHGNDLKRKFNKARREIGYCPQFDALLDDLTGKELIKIYALIRGIRKRDIPIITKYLAFSFGFEKHLKKSVKHYSGGNKRKLSAAIAMIGDPKAIFLDEPTTGMDPASRRQIWNMICFVRDAGKSIVLTTQSMEECEALCTRAAIMVNGEFKCVGSIQHLKNKFSKDIVLKIKVKIEQGRLTSARFNFGRSTMFRESRDASRNVDESLLNRDSNPFYLPVENMEADRNYTMTNDQNTQAAKDFVFEHFPNAKLKEEHQGVLTFYIPAENIAWSEIFGLMERNSSTLNYEDYSISQTSFEEIFLAFAMKQEVNKVKGKIDIIRVPCRNTPNDRSFV